MVCCLRRCDLDLHNDRGSALATPLIACLTLVALGFVGWLFARHNYWAVVLLVWVLIQGGFMYWQWALGKARVLLPWFVVSIAALLAFTVFAPVPVTTINMEVNKRSISAAVTLNLADQNTSERGSTDARALGWLDTDWISRHSLGRSTLTLFFGDALDDELRNYEVRFGKHPARFHLAQIAVGSDILGIAYPLKIWRGEQIVDSDLFKPILSNLKLLDSGHVELLGPNTRPAFGLTLNRSQVSSDPDASRDTVYRLIWAFLFLLIPCLFLVAARSARKLDRTTRWIATWLSG